MHKCRGVHCVHNLGPSIDTTAVDLLGMGTNLFSASRSINRLKLSLCCSPHLGLTPCHVAPADGHPPLPWPALLPAQGIRYVAAMERHRQSTHTGPWQAAACTCWRQHRCRRVTSTTCCCHGRVMATTHAACTIALARCLTAALLTIEGHCGQPQAAYSLKACAGRCARCLC